MDQESAPVQENNSRETSCNDVRIAVVGNVDSGKSTLIGVLTGGELDDGRGKARARIFVHNHELECGRTSSVSQHLMGFDEDGNPVRQSAVASGSALQKTKSWGKVVKDSEHVLTFIDLAGHEKYLKTTIAGLTGCFPDYAMVIVNSLQGISKMTKEHLGVVIALKIPMFVVVTKIDMVEGENEKILQNTKKQLTRVLKSPAAGKKMPITIRGEEDLDTVHNNPSQRHKIVPVFYISNKSGRGIDMLVKHLGKLKSRDWVKMQDSATEFDLDQTFSVPGVGIVVSGTVAKGTLLTNQELLLGPMFDGTFKPIFVKSIHSKRVPVEYCTAGDSCALAIKAVKRKEPIVRNILRPGMVLLEPKMNPIAVRYFEADILVLHHPTTIKPRYQAVIHCGIVRQTAALLWIDRECLRTGDKARATFRFMQRVEFIRAGSTFIFREGNTKGIGWIVKPLAEEPVHPGIVDVRDAGAAAKEKRWEKAQLRPNNGTTEQAESPDPDNPEEETENVT